MVGRLSVFVAVVLVICAEFPRSNGFQWLEPTTSSDDPKQPALIEVVYYPSNVSVTMIWKWWFSGSEAFSGVVIKRHKVNDQLNTEVHVASYVFDKNGPSPSINSTYYSQQVSTGKDGDITFTIKDITKQTKNKDGGTVNVLAREGDYVFTCELNAAFANPTQRSSAIKLIVNEKPKITTPPQSRYINKANKEVKLKCIATGKPKPVINWEIRKYGGLSATSVGPEITIASFKRDDVGVYKCKAKNVYGEDTAEAFLQYTACASGCSSKDLAIEMKQLNYQDGYDNENSENYKKLKKQIETECLQLYTKQSDPNIYSCVVTGFRKGSVVAKMKLTYPSGTNDPDKPLRDAIKTGKFAGYDVATSFVTFVSPKIIYPQSQACNPLTVCENQDATLVCNVTGKPTPTITWTKDGVPLSKQGSPLVLQNVVRNQIGNYTCTADNGVGRTDTACWKLDVKCSCVILTSSEAPRTECPQDPSTVTTTVLGVLFGLSVVFNVVLIAVIARRKRETSTKGGMNMKIIPVNVQDNNPSSGNQPDYEVIDNYSQPGQSPANPPLYQSVQPHSDTYSSLSPATKLPPKPTLPSTQSQANTHTSVSYQFQSP